MKNKKTFKHKIHSRNGHLIAVGNTVSASDFLTKSTASTTPSSNSGKVAKAESDGFIDPNFIYNGFGGGGSDGALSISSGTTTLDLGGSAVFIKNYTSVSITGTAKLAFTNPHANGTIIIIRCRGNFTVTSSSNPAIDASGMGSDVGNPATSNTGFTITGGGNGSASGGTPIAGTAGTAPCTTVSTKMIRNVFIACGSAGGNGGATNGFTCLGAGGGGASLMTNGSAGATGFGTSGGSGGVGGRGGGALYIEVAGAYNVTGIMNANGVNGTNASGTTGSGGGGGAGGCIVIRYKTLTANSGTYNVNGGTGGTGNQGGAGGNGANGYTDISINKHTV